MTALKTTYDETQHCTARDDAKGKSVAMDCPYTGKGEELTPGNLLEAALSGCMLLSMGAVALRDDSIDLNGTSIVVDLVGTPPPKIGYRAVNIMVTMPACLADAARRRLEKAAQEGLSISLEMDAPRFIAQQSSDLARHLFFPGSKQEALAEARRVASVARESARFFRRSKGAFDLCANSG